METKFFRMAIKELGDEGNLTGYLSVFNNVDRGKDLIRPGSFTQTLKETEGFPLLWAHSSDEPHLVVGSFHGKQDKHGLLIDANFFRDLPGGKDAYDTVKKLKENKVKVGLSIGYEATDAKQIEIDGESVREISAIKLYEGSLTLFPMNQEAVVRAIKEGLETVSGGKEIEFRCASCGETQMIIRDIDSEPESKAVDTPDPEKSSPADSPPKEDEQELEALRTLVKGFKI